MPVELQFLLYFLGLNSLFFLPRYFMERSSSTFFPYKGLLSGPLAERVRFLINRFNYDIFRLSFDFFLLVMGCYFLLPVASVGALAVVGSLIFIVLLSYQIYYHIFESIYRIEPVFFSDWLMLKTGASLFFRDLKGLNGLILLAILGLLVGLFFAFRQMLHLLSGLTLSWPWWGGIGIITLLGFYSLVTYNYKAFGKIVFPSQTQSLLRNIRQSLRTRNYLRNFDFESLSQYQPYQHLALAKRPNIYFLVLESYGKVLYDHPELKETYMQQLQGMEAALRQKNWRSCTHLSQSPITAGASWIAYTSALFGFHIPDQGAYVSLLHRPEMRKYQHLMRWLKEQGYQTYRPSSIAGFKGMKIPWDDYQDFYALDRWMKYEDMDYTGRLYGFGPCPPDQFTLGYAQQVMAQQASPHFLFFITQNSHNPFVAPPLAADWTQLNDGSQGKDLEHSSSIFQQPKLSDYREAIRYQLEFVEQFILAKAKPEDVFVILGDHQPPVISRAEDGRQTPVHIISQSEALQQAFRQMGFEEGLKKTQLEDHLYHEALFSMVVRGLYQAFGDGKHGLPDIKPKGLIFDAH